MPHYHPTLFFLLLQTLITTPSSSQPPNIETESPLSLHLSISIIVGVFSLMFSATFLLLMYFKFCRRHSTTSTTTTTNIENRAFSGIDKSVIDSLPFFLSSALTGSRRAHECSVCLSKFLDHETLRLLPTCNHVFHAPCIDRWLGSHSTCPLCRCRLDPARVLLNLKYSTTMNSFRIDEEEEVEGCGVEEEGEVE